MKIYKLILLIVVSFSLFGCMTRYEIDIDTMGNIDKEKIEYVIIPMNENIEENDLLYKEFAKYVTKTLENKGYIKADNIEKSEVIIGLNFKIGDPQRITTTTTVPTFGQTGFIASNTTGTVSTYGNTSTYTANTSYVPTYGVTGSYQRTRNVSVYTRYISIQAIDSKSYLEQEIIMPIWKTIITSTGTSNDFRKIFPIMMLAAYDYVGIDTTGKKKVIIPANEKKIQKQLFEKIGIN